MIKITFEYEDGSKKILEGEDVCKWNEWIGDVCFLAHNHQMNPNWNSLNWKNIEKKEDNIPY